MKKATPVCCLLFLLASTATAQLAAIGPDGKVRQDNVQVLDTRINPNTYGTASLTALTLSSFAFTGFNSSDAHQWSGGRYLTSGIELVAPVVLPEGALVSAIEVDACDTSVNGQVRAFLSRCPSPGGGGCFSGINAGTGGPDTPGCGNFSTTAAPITIDNIHNTYMIEMVGFDLTSATRFNGVRLYYKLQVSPAPGTATFSDVPLSHPFFQYIEALYAAGITGGCASPPLQYCPDAPITRGQMAVYLSRALGLHWAP